MKFTNKDLEDYIELLEVDFQSPDLTNLERIVHQQFCKIPFENISKLFYRKCFGLVQIPDLHQFIKGNKEHSLGGTCYSNNYYLYMLLKYLGYKVKLCGADMDRINAHIAIVVQVHGQEYLVDVGYAAPFFKPILLDSPSDQEILYGMDKFVVSPKDEKKGTRISMYRRNQFKNGYYLKPARRQITDFNLRIVESFNSSSTFLNSLLIAKMIAGKYICVHDFQVITTTENDFFIEIIMSEKELVGLIEEKFGIPAAFSRDAIKDIQSFSDAWDVKIGLKGE